MPGTWSCNQHLLTDTAMRCTRSGCRLCAPPMTHSHHASSPLTQPLAPTHTCPPWDWVTLTGGQKSSARSTAHHQTHQNESRATRMRAPARKEGGGEEEEQRACDTPRQLFQVAVLVRQGCVCLEGVWTGVRFGDCALARRGPTRARTTTDLQSHLGPETGQRRGCLSPRMCSPLHPHGASVRTRRL